MKKSVLVLLTLTLLVLLMREVFAVSSDLRDTYAPRETIIGKLSGIILAPITLDQVTLKRGHVEVALEGEIKKLGDAQSFWLIAPESAGVYTLKIEDVIAIEQGVPQVVDYEKTFLVNGSLVAYSINPGIVFASNNFEIDVIVYAGSDIPISVDFPIIQEVMLHPGTQNIDFSIESIVGNRFVSIAIGDYSVPAFIIGAEYICGDGYVHNREVCDGNNLTGNNCSSINDAFTSGNLSCSSDCLSFDTSNCAVIEESCDADTLELCLSTENCTSVGGFWYNETCNRYEVGAQCDSTHVGLCSTQGTCIDAGGYWYNGTCNEAQQPSCTLARLDLCLDQVVCAGVGGYWYLDRCHDELQEAKTNESDLLFGEPIFLFRPGIIRSTILVSEPIPVYQFALVNIGMTPLEDVLLLYDHTAFSISPSMNLSVAPNESVVFTVQLANYTKGKVRGAVVAFVRDAFEYMLVEIDSTNDENETGTDYLKFGSSGDPSYYCSELSGKICGGEETCDGEVVSSLDGLCCLGQCESTSEGGNAWLGWLIAGILIFVILIVFVRYRKTGKTKNPLGKRVSEVEGRIP